MKSKLNFINFKYTLDYVGCVKAKLPLGNCNLPQQLWAARCPTHPDT